MKNLSKALIKMRVRAKQIPPARASQVERPMRSKALVEMYLQWPEKCKETHVARGQQESKRGELSEGGVAQSHILGHLTELQILHGYKGKSQRVSRTPTVRKFCSIKSRLEEGKQGHCAAQLKRCALIEVSVNGGSGVVLCRMYVAVGIGLEARVQVGLCLETQCNWPSKRSVFGARLVVKGVSGKLDWDCILMVKLMIFVEVLNIGC